MSMIQPTPSSKLHSIGAVADATGVSTHTLRVWQRRYGRPVPLRLPSGHRRFTGEQLNWLRRVAEALARGHRPGAVVPMEEAELERLLGAERPLAKGNRWVELALALDFTGFERELGQAWQRLGWRSFLTDALGPALVAIGSAWADGRLEVRHEHFATECVDEFLRLRRREFTPRFADCAVLLSTLPGERHGLGLHMAALCVAAQGFEVRVLGLDTPVAEIAEAAKEARAVAVAISISLANGGAQADRQLAELRLMLPSHVHLLAGGSGARGVRRGPRGVEYAVDFASFEAWLLALSRNLRLSDPRRA